MNKMSVPDCDFLVQIRSYRKLRLDILHGFKLFRRKIVPSLIHNTTMRTREATQEQGLPKRPGLQFPQVLCPTGEYLARPRWIIGPSQSFRTDLSSSLCVCCLGRKRASEASLLLPQTQSVTTQQRNHGLFDVSYSGAVHSNGCDRLS